MENTWILVADAARARIYSVNKQAFLANKTQLQLHQTYMHPESRTKDVTIASDRLGNYHGKGGSGGGSFQEASNPKDYEAELFARELVHALESGRVAHAFSDLIIVAPPGFYGLLNKGMHTPLKNLIECVVEKDYSREKDKALGDILLKLLQSR